jgi:hypothetical protein
MSFAPPGGLTSRAHPEQSRGDRQGLRLALSYVGLAADLHEGTRGGPLLFVLFVIFGMGFGAAYSSLVAHALVRVAGALPLARTVRSAMRPAATN